MVRMVLALVAISSAVFAAEPLVPEIDANMGVSAISMLAGGMMVLRGRRKK
jgi:hypothetical protein